MSLIGPPPGLVLDTNVVLDWLVFADAGVSCLVQAVESGSVCWSSCLRMREELLRTLAYESLARWKPDRERTLARYDRYARMQPLPAMAPPSLRPSDPDDQIFVDLAVEVKARWLVTHDRSLLRLARAARARGLLILEPADWQAPG